MRKMIALLAPATALGATPAVAQDAQSTFDGFHIEAIGGYDIVEISIDEEVFGEKLSDDQGGFAYGVAAGYDVLFGGSLLGVEIEYADATTSVSYDYAGDAFDSDVDLTWGLEAGRDLYVGARLGGQLSERSLVYVKAGYTNAVAKLVANGTVDGENFAESVSATFDGLRLGVGSELTISGNAFAKIEYRLSMYGDGEADIDGENADIGEIFDYGDLDRHQIILGLGMRF